MAINNKRIEDITGDDLQSLVDDVFSEWKFIEYKQTLPGCTESDKKEVLADISSFANASDGNIVYGIKEANDKPVEVCGCETSDPGAAILRLEESLKDVYSSLPRGFKHFSEMFFPKCPYPWRVGPDLIGWTSESGG